MTQRLLGRLQTRRLSEDSLKGLLAAGTIIMIWCMTLTIALTINLSQISVLWIFLIVLLRTLLHTGLFVTTHEAIHRTITRHQNIDDAIGHVTAILYAFLLYQNLAENHRRHHRHPATDQDPDFCASHPHNPVIWYFTFMRRYQNGPQFWTLFWGMTVIFWGLIFFQIPAENVVLFWVLPILLSSLQLFWFGVYLPHRPSEVRYRDRHRARSNQYSTFWSLITCYHFGYHWEHHQYPTLAWYQLAAAYREGREKGTG